MDRRTFLTRSVGCTAGLSLIGISGIARDLSAAEEEKTKEQIFKELDEKVDKYMPKYMSCSLSSFWALNDQFQLGADERTLRALWPFTGGLSLKGETCGAVSGSMLALGYYFEPRNAEEAAKTGSSMAHGGTFMDRFKEAFTSTRCWGVQKHLFGRYYDATKPEEQKEFMLF